MKDTFTIEINNRFFIPTIKEDIDYYYVDYVGHWEPFKKGYSILKSDIADKKNLKAIKKVIKQDIYETLYK